MFLCPSAVGLAGFQQTRRLARVSPHESALAGSALAGLHMLSSKITVAGSGHVRVYVLISAALQANVLLPPS